MIAVVYLCDNGFRGAKPTYYAELFDVRRDPWSIVSGSSPDQLIQRSLDVAAELGSVTVKFRWVGEYKTLLTPTSLLELEPYGEDWDAAA